MRVILFEFLLPFWGGKNLRFVKLGWARGAWREREAGRSQPGGRRLELGLREKNLHGADRVQLTGYLFLLSCWLQWVLWVWTASARPRFGFLRQHRRWATPGPAGLGMVGSLEVSVPRTSLAPQAAELCNLWPRFPLHHSMATCLCHLHSMCANGPVSESRHRVPTPLLPPKPLSRAILSLSTSAP